MIDELARQMYDKIPTYVRNAQREAGKDRKDVRERRQICKRAHQLLDTLAQRSHVREITKVLADYGYERGILVLREKKWSPPDSYYTIRLQADGRAHAYLERCSHYHPHEFHEIELHDGIGKDFNLATFVRHGVISFGKQVVGNLAWELTNEVPSHIQKGKYKQMVAEKPKLYRL